MLKIYDLFEGYTEAQVDEYIKARKSIPTNELWSANYNLNTVVESDSYKGTFYLAEDDDCVWWFGPRNIDGIAAGQYDHKWFCFRTEDGEYHKFDMTDIAHSRAAMNKILEWIAKGNAIESNQIELANDSAEFMDI